MSENTSAEVRLIASSKNWIEGTAVQQLRKTAALPGMRFAAGLPDLHPGKGSPIGAAFVVEGRLYPALVGSDIGCGIGLWRTSLRAKALKREVWADRLRKLDGEWEGDGSAFLDARGIERSGFEHSLGTVGSGNHFAELQVIESVPGVLPPGFDQDAVYLCVHSGSREFGEAVLQEHLARFGPAGLDASSEEGRSYLSRHSHAVKWASANRELIALRLCERLKTQGVRLLDICHNSVQPCDFDGRSCWIHRKGAAPSTEGIVMIPGSRGALSYVVTPRNPTPRSAFSLAHGAGRKWSRSESRGKLERRFSAKDLMRTDLGSHVICEDKDLLYEEAPQAYKNITVVVDDLVQAGLAEVVAMLKPIVTYKVRR